MTLVAAFATPDFAVMVADRRRVNIENTSIYYDDVKKIARLTDSVMVGYGGNYQLAQHIIKETTRFYGAQDDVKRIAEVYHKGIQSLLEQGMTREQMDVSFQFAGLDRDGAITLSLISQFDGHSLNHYASSGPVAWTLTYADYNPSSDIETYISGLKETTPAAVEHFAALMTKHTSENDALVSPAYDLVTFIR